MSKIILDCDLMRFPNSGLYYYCLNLGMYVNELLGQQGKTKVKFYVPPQEKNSFGSNKETIVEKRHHRFFKPFLWDCRIWHAPFQSGRILPKSNTFTKIILTIHDLNFLHEGKPLHEQRKSLAHTQSLINKSDVIICISEFCKSDVLKHCEVNNKTVYVIHNGTHDLQEPQLHAASYKPQRPFLFAIGYVNRKKNFHTLLNLIAQNNDEELIIAGRLDEPDYVAALKQSAVQKGISHRVHVLGPVTDGEKSWYLKHCKAYVHPSLAEGFGATVVEAMTFGKPLFLSHLTSLPEIGSDVAFYFKKFDAEHMQQVYSAGMAAYQKNGLAQKIVARGHVFNWQQKAAEYVQVYDTFL